MDNPKASPYAIRKFGDPGLKQESRLVTEFGPDLRRLVELMLKIMDESEGIGLAAPQIGIGDKVIVWRDPDSEEEFAMANPRIVERGGETLTLKEACLSVPGPSVEVPRSERVVVQGQGLDGEPMRVEAEGMLARILQHEIDHLEGHLILDRTTPEERRAVLKEIRERALGA